MLREAKPEKERCNDPGPLGMACEREKGHDGMHTSSLTGEASVACWGEGTDPSPTITANVSHMAKQIRQAAAEDDRYKKWRESRRLRAVRIDEQRVLSAVLFSTENLPRWVLKHKHPAVPEGTIVQSVFHDFMAGSFVFHLWHQSFDPVEEGGIVPWLDGFVPSELQVEAVELPPKTDWTADEWSQARAYIDLYRRSKGMAVDACFELVNSAKTESFDGSTGLPDEPVIRIGERSPPDSVQ